MYREIDGRYEFFCASCEEWFETDKSMDKIAMEECERIWGTTDIGDFDLICESCWQELNPLLPENKEMYETTLAKIRYGKHE